MRQILEYGKVAFLPLLCAAVIGCTTGQTLPPPPEALVTFDGLVPFDGSGFQNAWVREDFDFSGYGEVLLQPVELEFRVPEESKSRWGVGVREIALSEEDKLSLEALFSGAIEEQIADSQYFAVTNEPGPETLKVHVRLLDIRALAPLEPDPTINIEIPASPNIVVSSIGEATIVAEFFDATNGEILARAVERRAARQAVGGAETSRLSGWVELRPAADRWGRLITGWLDQFHDLPAN